jgi:hypothetical protein
MINFQYARANDVADAVRQIVRLREAFDAAPRFALIDCCVFAGLRLVARRRLT